MKANTFKLTCSQSEKIHRLAATAALRAAGEEKAVPWRSNVAGPAKGIVASWVLAGGEQGKERLHGVAPSGDGIVATM